MSGDISIHALLAESDMYPSQCRTLASDFYPRSPCGERPLRSPRIALMVGFLSTLSLRRATPQHTPQLHLSKEFLSTLSLRRATTSVLPTIPAPAISIHALLAESDTSILHKILADWDFYPRSPCGERRGQNPGPRTGTDFYPRSPCGERLERVNSMLTLIQFLSTLSLRRAT